MRVNKRKQQMGGGAMLYNTLLPKNPSTGLPSPSPSSPNPNPVFPVSASYSASARPRNSASCSTFQGPVNGGGGGLQPSSASAFGPVPSQVEIERAIAALLFFLKGISSSGSEMNWMELLGCCDPRMLISAGLGRVSRAFHLLQTDPPVKRLVTSLASDRALWEAIMNNESVRKLGQALSAEISVHASENGRPRIREEAAAEPDSGSDNLLWFMDIVKERIMELIEKFKSLVNEIFQQYSDSMKQARAGEITPAQLEEKVRSSLLLAVVILLIVVLERVREA